MNFALKLKFAQDVARGMFYLHSSNPIVLHRDLKSDNLLVDAVSDIYRSYDIYFSFAVLTCAYVHL